MRKLLFATTNKGKLAEAVDILKGHTIENIGLELTELQGSTKDIAIAKAEEAFRITGEPVFVEDTALMFEEFGELPGPYIKDFIANIGIERIPKLLDGFESKKARVVCTIAFKEPEKPVILFEGTVNGSIVSARGQNGFQFDRIFMPNGHDLTFAQMSMEEKNAISHRKKAFLAFLEFLKS